MTVTANEIGSIAGHIKVFTIVEWVALFIFLCFLAALALTGLSMLQRVKKLRSRKVQPILERGKRLAKDGAAIAEIFMDRGKRIFEVSKQTAETVGERAQTTANVVRGAMPEAKRLPTEVAATTRDLRRDLKQTVHTARRLQRGIRVVQSVRAASRILGSFKAVAKTAKGAVRSAGREITPDTRPPATEVGPLSAPGITPKKEPAAREVAAR